MRRRMMMQATESGAKYPLVNGQFGFGIWGDFNAYATMTISNGSHIRIDRTDKTINGVWYINLSNGNENGYSPTSVTNINNKSTKFILNPGDNCTLKVTNIMSNSDAVFAFDLRNANTSLGFNTGDSDSLSDRIKNVVIEKVENVECLFMYIKQFDPDTYIEFDVEFTVNGERWI